MKNITKILAVCLILIASLALAGCSAKDLTGRFIEETGESKAVSAVVNGEKIYEDYMERQYKIISSNYQMFGMSLSKMQLLENALIPQMLLVQEAKKEGTVVTDEEVTEFVDAEMAKITESMPEDQLMAQLDQLGVTLEELKADNEAAYRTQLYIQRLLEKVVWSGIEVSEDEARDYYDNNIDQFKAGEQVRASHILAKVNATITYAEAKKKIEDIEAKLISGEDFAELAKEYSDCPSGTEGGDLGYFETGAMVPEFEEAVFALSVGELSNVVKTRYGYHIIKLTAKIPERMQTFDELKEEITQQLIMGKQRAAEDTYISQLKSKAEIEILFEEAVDAVNLVLGEE